MDSIQIDGLNKFNRTCNYTNFECADSKIKRVVLTKM